MERYDYNLENPEEQALDYYANNIRPYIKKLFPEGIDKTTIINGSVFVNKDGLPDKRYSGVFKKVLIKFKNYGRLENIDYDFKSKLFEVFLKESISKKNLGQFFTPIKVVRAIGEMAKDEVKPNIKICDPASGVGKFLLEPIRTKIDQLFEVKKGEIISKIQIHGFDKGFEGEEQKTIILAKANMLIYFSDLIKDNPTITNKFSELFNKSFELKTNSILGTLSDPIENEYDLILTNPPYVTSGSGSLKEEIANNTELKDYYKVNAMGVEGLFMEWIVRALKPAGKAFIIVPDGIFNRQNDKNLRQFLLNECYIDAIISLPLNTFFTTNKKTYILCITKKEDKKVIQTDPVFTYLVSEMGESRDVYRFDIEQDDLSEAVNLYSFFKGNKTGFKKINTDKRCKLLPIDFLTGNVESSWIIDKNWNEEEKIELGIIDKTEKLTVLGFSLLVEDVANSLKNFESEIKEIAQKKKTKVTFIKLKIKDLFDIQKGQSKYTKSYGNSNKGNYPVYSASNNSELTNIDTFDFDGEYITWATNGFAGYMKIINGKFSINGDRALLSPKLENINLIYIKEKLQPIFRNLAKGRKGEKGEDEFTKVYPSMIENIEINIPIDEFGELDKEAQEIVVKKINYINEIKSKISEYKKQIEELNVEIVFDFKVENIKIKKLFEILGEENLTKSFIESNKGEFPVYSGQIENGGVFGHINTYTYDETLLTWVTYGNSGQMKKVSGKFSIGRNNCGLRPLTENLDIDYFKYIAQPVFVENVKGEKQKSLPQSIVKNIEIPIPVTNTGQFDLEAQLEIAQKYRKIEKIKNNISSELEKIANIEIDYE